MEFHKTKSLLSKFPGGGIPTFREFPPEPRLELSLHGDRVSVAGTGYTTFIVGRMGNIVSKQTIWASTPLNMLKADNDI